MAKRFHSEFVNLRGSVFNVEIWDDEFVGESTPIKLADYGYNIRYTNENGERYTAVIGSECEVGVYITDVTVEGLITDLTTSQEGRFTIRITRGVGAALQWVGRIMLDISILEDIQYPYLFTVKATDGISALKKIPYNNDGVAYFGNKRLTEHLTNALRKLSHVDEHYGASDIFLVTSVDWWEDSMTPAKTADPIQLTWLDHASWWDFKNKGEREYKSCYDVLENIARTFGCRLWHVNGAYFLEQVTYRTGASVETREYDKTGTYLSNETLTGTTTINQTVDAARLTMTHYDFFAPVRYARVTQAVNTRVNYIGGYTFDQDNTDLTIYQAIEANGGQTTLRLTGNMNMTVTNDSYSNPGQQVMFVFEFKVRVGTKYALRQYQVNYYNWTYNPSSWAAGTGSRVSYILSAWPIPTIGNTSTFSIPINWTSAALGEGSGTTGAEFSVNLVNAFYTDGTADGAPAFLGDFTIAWEFDDPWMEVLSYGQPYLNDDEVVHFTDANANADNTTVIEVDTLLGDAINPNTVARFKKGSSETALTNTTLWGPGTADSDTRICSLLAKYLFNGQAVPIRKLNGTVTGGIDLRKTITVNAVKYLFLGGSFSAAKDEITGEWFELNYGVAGVPITPIPRRKHRYSAPDPGQNNIPAGNAGAGGGPETENIGSPPASYLRPVAYATSDGPISAGVTTTIAIEQTLVFGDFVEDDVVTIVHPVKGFFEDLTISATSLDGDTSLDVTGTLLLDYPPSSFILKKPLLSAFKLPGGAADKDILVWDSTANRWQAYTLTKYVDDAAAIADGLEAGNIYVVDVGNDGIPEGVLKMIL
jgi:hypothetical protein